MGQSSRPTPLIRKHTQELTDASAQHLSTPGPDTGSFSTLEVRARTNPAEITSRAIAFPPNHYARPPNVAGGFTMLDLSAADTPAVRANLVGSDISRRGFRIGLETWEGGVMWAAAATWIEHKAGAKECHFGQFDTMDVDDDDDEQEEEQEAVEADVEGGSPVAESGLNAETLADGASSSDADDDEDDDDGYDGEEQPHPRQDYTRTSAFPVKFDSPPSVVCWLNRLDLPVGPSHKHFRVRATASNITRTSASFSLSTWGDLGDSVLNGAALCWIAFPQGKKKVDSGTFGVGDDASPQDGHKTRWKDDDRKRRSSSKGKNTGRVEFRTGWFAKPPTVLVALNMLDMDGGSDLRINAEVEDVDAKGFTWRLETWDDSILYAAEASWIALGFV